MSIEEPRAGVGDLVSARIGDREVEGVVDGPPEWVHRPDGRYREIPVATGGGARWRIPERDVEPANPG